jgi:hypothetical protein
MRQKAKYITLNLTNRTVMTVIVMFLVQFSMFGYLTTSPAQATLLDGKNITTAFYFPDKSTIGFGGVPVVSTVGPGIEIATSPQGYPITSIDFSDTSIALDFFQTLTGSVAAFNGWRFYDATGTIPAFTNAVLTTSNTTGWTVSFDENNIWLNGSGSNYNVNSTLRIDISADTSAVAEPISLLFLGLGLVGLVGTKRKLKG